LKQYIFTRIGFQGLEKVIAETQEKIDKIMAAKAEGAKNGDGWHSEQFKVMIAEEITWLTQMEKLKEIKRRAKIVDPPEQNEFVTIGNGVVIQRNDEQPEKYFLGGYRLDNPPKKHISIQSPLGKALVRAKVGDIKIFQVESQTFTVKILEIILPSQAKDILWE